MAEDTSRPGYRAMKKSHTRIKIMAAARLAFVSDNYHDVTVRDLARSAGVSTGAIFANFANKEELFMQVMGFAPPTDGPVTRAAPLLLASLIAAQEGLARNSQAWTDAQRAIELAQSPLDGEVWARHLEGLGLGGVSIDLAAPVAPLSVVLQDAAGA